MSDNTEDNTTTTSSLPNPTTGLFWFMIVTSVYMGILYFLGSQKNKTPEAIKNMATQNRIFG